MNSAYVFSLPPPPRSFASLRMTASAPSGFSLLETMITLGIAAVFLVFSLQATTTVQRYYAQRSAQFTQYTLENYLHQRIGTTLRNATGLLPESNAAICAVMNHSDPPKKVLFDYWNGKLRERLGASTQYLSEEGQVTALSFAYQGTRVSINMTMKDGRHFSQVVCRRNE